jgi:hypothetical protein
VYGGADPHGKRGDGAGGHREIGGIDRRGLGGDDDFPVAWAGIRDLGNRHMLDAECWYLYRLHGCPLLVAPVIRRCYQRSRRPAVQLVPWK